MKSTSATSLASGLGKKFDVTDANPRMLKQTAKRGEDEHAMFEAEIATFSEVESFMLQSLSKLVYYGMTLILLLLALTLSIAFS